MSKSSLELPPLTIGIGRIFLKSQFRTRVPKAPSSTSLAGKTAIITGASSGIGYHCCLHLLSLNLSHLILAVRSTTKGNTAASKFRSLYPNAEIEVWELEMTSYPSIQSFASRVSTSLSRLDICILNAGIVKPDFFLNPTTGHEEVFQVNYLSTMLLAILLLPALKFKSPAGTPGRLTIVGSGMSYMATFPNRSSVPLIPSFDSVSITPWDATERYALSKTVGHYFLAKLWQLGYVDPNDVIINIVDPGYCKGSGLHRDAHGVIGMVLSVSKRLTGRTLDEGAWCYVDAAVVKGKESHGSFVMDWEIKPFANLVYEANSQPIMDRLWEETMKEFEFAGAESILKNLTASKSLS